MKLNGKRIAALSQLTARLLPSPTMTTFLPSMVPRRSSTVRMSAMTWQGWFRSVSPLITGTRRARQVDDFAVVEPADHDAVAHPAEDLRHVVHRLARADPDFLVRDEHRLAAELAEGDLEADARAQARLGEHAGQHAVGVRVRQRVRARQRLGLLGEVEHGPQLGQGEIVDGQEIPLVRHVPLLWLGNVRAGTAGAPQNSRSPRCVQPYRI